MPLYFYKATEYLDICGDLNKKWIHDFDHTIADFMPGCEKIGSHHIVILPVLMHPNEIERHTNTELMFEFRCYGPVSSDRINFTRISPSFSEVGDVGNDPNLPMLKTDTHRMGRHKLINFVEKSLRSYGSRRDYLYFHVTCEKNVEIIRQRGLIDVDDNHTDIVIQRIGDRDNEDDHGSKVVLAGPSSSAGGGGVILPNAPAGLSSSAGGGGMEINPDDPDFDLFSGGGKTKRKSALTKRRKKTALTKRRKMKMKRKSRK